MLGLLENMLDLLENMKIRQRNLDDGIEVAQSNFVAIIPSGVAVGRRSMLDPC